MIAEDNRGAQYNYGESGFPENSPDTSAVEWSGNPELRPDAAEDGFAASVELASYYPHVWKTRCQYSYHCRPEKTCRLISSTLQLGVLSGV